MAQQLWAGIDAGKSAHHCVVVDADGKTVFSRRAANDEATLGELITEVSALTDDGGSPGLSIWPAVAPRC